LEILNKETILNIEQIVINLNATMNRQILKISTLLFGVIILGWGCVKTEFDSPPIREIPVGNIKTIADLRSMIPQLPVTFDEDFSVFATVTADERNGNLYRNVYVQDPTGAINVRLQTPGGIYQGDSVSIYLKGTILSLFNGMLQLDNVNIDNNIIKQKTNVSVAPKIVSITEINSSLQSQLIRLENVEFKATELGNTYANAVTQQTQNRILTDCNGNEVIVRTSGFAGFANQSIPLGNGSFVGIVGEFNGTMQLYIRDINEVLLGAERCDGTSGGVNPVDFVDEDFSGVSHDVDFAKAGWVNKATAGSRIWRGRIFQNNEFYVQASAFNSFDAVNTYWLITPPVRASGSNTLNFKTAKSFYNHNSGTAPLSVWISTNFDGNNIENANWIEITNAYIASNVDTDNSFVLSGNINLAAYLPQGYLDAFYVGFRYTGSSQIGTSTMRIDDIKIY
jgi:hypothetical protein